MTDAARFPCAQCGAALRFSPGDQQLVCTHCGHVHPITTSELWPDGRAPELSYAAALADEIEVAPVAETRTVSCSSCGATVDFHEAVQAEPCPFCASPLVLEVANHRRFTPRGVLPFALTEKEARGALARWLRGLWFAPNDVAGYARSERPLTGVYLPFWTFDADTRSSYSGERGTVHYVTRQRMAFRDGKQMPIQQRVPKVRWTPVTGTVSRHFDDILVMATRTLPPREADRLGGARGGWDLHDLQPYQPDYLAGFRAEAYSVDLEEGFHAARAVMDMQIRRDVRFNIGGDRQRVRSVDTTLSDVTFKHILLPVWIATYRYRDRSFRFVVNGRTGEVMGERPYSIWKIAGAIMATAILFVALAAAFGASGAF